MSDSFRKIPTEKLLRAVAAARAAGDWRTAEDEWWACVTRAKERVEYIVDRHVYKRLVAAADRDDIVQRALLRGFRQLVKNLDDLSENAFFAAMVQVAKRQCQDDGRAYANRKRRSRSLDEPAGDDDDTAGRFDALTHRQARADWERADDLRELDRALHGALERLRDPRARVILTAMLAGGVSDDQLAEQLDTSTNNVQQIRSRALRELRNDPTLRGLIDP